ncbi:MAG: hypothetical protein M3Z20_04115 [Chloroflexota bacterium]|nr:hypothetical protein [Chloroflexota bacterium]
MQERPALDPFGQAYARLSFGLERHVPGFIDAWLGSDADRAALEPASVPAAAELVAEAEALKTQAASLETSPQRREYLLKQITAMETVARTLAGEQFPYREEVRLLFDVEPSAKPEAMFEDAIRDLDALTPGDGPVLDRLAAWRAQYIVTPETARKLVDVILPELRARTRAIVELPDDEAIEIRMVSDKPWSGYNWYLGHARSRVDLNTDLPIHAYRLTELLAHEGYPGHHTEHFLKERLYAEQGFGEHALQLINTPECLISEGIATTAEGMAFSPAELAAFRREHVYPAAGITGDPEREIAINAARARLSSVPSNAALLLHEAGADPEEVVAYLQRYGLSTEAEARQRLRFISDPLWRAYIFTYDVGRELVLNWLGEGPEAARRQRYARLLTEQMTPSQLVASV